MNTIMNKFNFAFAVCLLGIGFMQSAQATIVYSSAGAVPGFSGAPATVSINDTFDVEAGIPEYKVTLKDIGTVALPLIDNFDALSLVIFDNNFDVVGSPLLLTPASGSGAASAMFSFTAPSDATYSIVLGGATDALSTYAATITAVPVPAAVWFMGTAMLGLLTVGRTRKA